MKKSVHTRIWKDERFRALGDQGKLLFLHLLTHPGLTRLGTIRATVGELAAALGWSAELVRERLVELAPMVLLDEGIGVLALPNYLRYNRPCEDWEATAIAHALEALAESPLGKELAASITVLAATWNGTVRAGLPAFLQPPDGAGKSTGRRTGKLAGRFTGRFTGRHAGQEDVSASEDSASGPSPNATTAAPGTPVVVAIDRDPDPSREQDRTAGDAGADSGMARTVKTGRAGARARGPAARLRTAFPSAFRVSAEVVAFCQARGLGDPHKQVDRFRAYHEAKGSLMADWDAALRTWMLNQQHFERERGPRPPAGAQRSLHFGGEEYGEGDSLAVGPPAGRK